MNGDHVAGAASPWRSALALGLVAMIGTALLAGVNQLTRERIEAQERRSVLEQLEQLVGAERYDNAMHEDQISLQGVAGFATGQEITVYRARMAGEPVAVIMKLTTDEGYNGRIGLLVAVNADGSVSGVRVTSHKETPGLGDGIELPKSDWILGFNGRSLLHPAPAGWAVKRDGGVFDQFTGATITPRAVVDAVRNCLEYFSAHRDALFHTPPATGMTSDRKHLERNVG